MTPHAQFSRNAGADIEEIVWYYQQEAGGEIVERFREAVRRTVRMLADRPRLGAAKPWLTEGESELRTFLLCAPFDMYIIYYRPTDYGIFVLRIIHGARDAFGLL